MKDYSKFREEFAKICHEQWSGWIVYMFEKGHMNYDESLRLPPESVEHWTRQTITPYEDLSEKEKESDRKQADSFLDILEVDAILEASDEEIFKKANRISDKDKRDEFTKKTKEIIASEIKEKKYGT